MALHACQSLACVCSSPTCKLVLQLPTITKHCALLNAAGHRKMQGNLQNTACSVVESRFAPYASWQPHPRQQT